MNTLLWWVEWIRYCGWVGMYMQAPVKWWRARMLPSGSQWNIFWTALMPFWLPANDIWYSFKFNLYLHYPRFVLHCTCIMVKSEYKMCLFYFFFLRMLNEQLEKLRKEVSDFRVQNTKLSSQVRLAVDILPIYTERQKKLITSSERHTLKSKALKRIIIGLRLAKILLTKHI